MSEEIKPRTLAAECAAEFAGTLILILFGVGVVAQVVVGEGARGAHLNPAVTVTLALFRGFSWSKVAPYALAQTLGAFVAALIVRWNYSEVIAAIDPGHTIATQGIFSTLPGNGTLPVGIGGAFRDQVIGTAILLFVILAVGDVRNTTPGVNLAPFVIGLIVVAIGFAWGTNAGYAINPARDLGPRLASFLTGYGTAWRDQNGDLYFWVPIIAPLIGGPLGALLYDALVGRNLPVPDETDEPSRIDNDPQDRDKAYGGTAGAPIGETRTETRG